MATKTRRLTLFVTALLVALSWRGALAQNGSRESPYDFVAFLPDPTADADYLEMLDSFEAYADYMRATGVGEFRVHFFTKLSEVDGFIRSHRAEGRPPAIGVIHSLLVLRKANEWGFSPIACPVYDGSTTTREVVVTLRSHPAKNIDELAGQRLATVRVWGETPDLLGVTLFGKPVDPRELFSQLVPTESLNDCLMVVLRRGADAAMVNQAFFDAAQRRNRDVWKEFKILAVLPEQHIAPVVAFDGAPPALVEKVKAVILNTQETDAGKHLLEVFNLDGFEACGRESFEALEGKLLGPAREPAREASVSAPTAPATAPVPPGANDGPVAGVAEGVTVEGIEVEKDPDSGEVTAVIRFEGKAPAGVAALVAFDGGSDERLALECAENICVLTLTAEQVAGKRGVTLVPVVGEGAGLRRAGERKSYALR